jgi:hypothetical protein
MSRAQRGRGRPRGNWNIKENVNPDANMWAQMMQQNQQMMQLMQQQIQQNAQSQQQLAAAMQQEVHQQHPPPPVFGNPAFREYNRNHPPEFNGRGEPQEAKRWNKHMEKIFRMADCTKEEKLIFATNQFRGAAEDWWETAKRRMRTSGMEIVDYSLFITVDLVSFFAFLRYSLLYISLHTSL